MTTPRNRAALTLLTLALVLTAGGAARAQAPAPQAPQEKVTLTYAGFGGALMDAEPRPSSSPT